jgi:hypothetical protein
MYWSEDSLWILIHSIILALLMLAFLFVPA